MKKGILMILFIFIVTLSYSQNWNNTRNTEQYKSSYLNVEVGYEFGIGMDSINRVVTDFSLLINPSTKFEVGIGTGLRFYSKQEMVLLPIYIDIRVYPYEFRRTSWMPYISAKLGHSFNLSDSFNPIGFMVTPSVGAMYETRKYKFYSLSLTYSIQSVEQPQPPNENWNGLGLMFGYTF
jgi:hypothetical protein